MISLSAPRTGRLYPQNVLLSVRGWIDLTATVRSEVNKKSIDLSGNRNRGPLACSAVPQPTAPFRARTTYCFRQQTPQLKQINISRPQEASALVSYTSRSLTRLIHGSWRQISHLTSNIMVWPMDQLHCVTPTLFHDNVSFLKRWQFPNYSRFMEHQKVFFRPSWSLPLKTNQFGAVIAQSVLWLTANCKTRGLLPKW